MKGVTLAASTPVGAAMYRSSVLGRSSFLFGRRGGILNKGSFRIGWNWFGSAKWEYFYYPEPKSRH